MANALDKVEKKEKEKEKQLIVPRDMKFGLSNCDAAFALPSNDYPERLWKSHDETLSFRGKELTPFRGIRHEFQWKLHQHIRDEFVKRATRRKEDRNNQG